MQFIFYRPVAAYRFGNALRACASGQTADVVVRFFAGFLAHLTCAPDHGDGLQLRPGFVRPLQVPWHFNEPMLAALNTGMLADIAALYIVAVRLLRKARFMAFLKPRRHLLVQMTVVGFEVKHVSASLSTIALVIAF